MRDKTTRSIGATIVLLGVAIAAFAQIRPESPRSATSLAAPPSGSATDGPGTTFAEEPFVYRMGILSGITTDNFWEFYAGTPSVWNAYVLGPTKPALFTLDPETSALALELASTEAVPTTDDDGWHVEVSLREDMTWSDGEPITAEDFVFTLEAVRKLELGGSWAESYPPSLESAHSEGPHRLRIEFSQRPTLATWPHAVGLAPVMPSHIWAPIVDSLTDAAALYGMSGMDDVGGGPLHLEEVGENLIVSTANTGYSSAAAPDRVEYHVYPDEAAAVKALEDGLIDTILTPKGLTPQQAASVQGRSGIEVVTSPANGVLYIGFNLERQPMSDRAFREALALLVDREGMAEEIPTQGEVAKSFISRANETWYDTSLAATLRRSDGTLVERLAQAVDALGEAGYTWATEPSTTGEVVVPGTGLLMRGSEPAPLTILTPGDAYDPSRPLYASEIAAVLGWLGFDARPVETDFDTVVDLAFTPSETGVSQYDMYLLGWTLGSPALPEFYRMLFSTDGSMNNTGYSSDRFAQQLLNYEQSYDLETAKTALWSMEGILAEDLPYLLLYSSSINEVYRSDRVSYRLESALGGLQGRLGGITDVEPVSGTLAG